MNETIASALSNEEVKDILTKFVQTNTVNPPGNEKVLAQWIADDFKKAGIEAEVRDMAAFHAWIEENFTITARYPVTHGTAHLQVLVVD